jgi:hypothetical protein
MIVSRVFPLGIAATAFVSVSIASGPARAVTVFSGSGATATTAFNDFQAALGVGNVRRIGWDGVRLDGTDANPNTRVIVSGSTVEIPVDRFLGVGALYEDPYSVSGNGFATVNPDTAGQFPAFSPNNTFVMFDETSGQFDDRFIEQSFVIPGTFTAAATRGFGAIFADVEIPGSSSIEYFGLSTTGEEVSLGKFDVPVGANGEIQFLGVLFDAPVVTEVQLTVGTNALFSFNGTSFQSFGPESLGNGIDLAVTDDFLFATPTDITFSTVPEPTPISALGIVLGSALYGGIKLFGRRRRG